jgi:hypothetical protein
MPAGGLTDLFGTAAPTGVAAEVAAKAQAVAQTIGGADGFGGTMMNAYMGHMGDHMGFHSSEDLAEAGGHMNIELMNLADQPCTFHVAFVSSPDGSDEQTQDVTVPSGQTVTIDMPCSEIIGMGGLTPVEQMACHLEDGTELDNRMCVPGFLNSDFDCGGTFRCTLMQDTNDLDQDGNTDELIAVTSTMLSHIGQDGMSSHGGRRGMMFGAGMMSGLFGGGMSGGMMSGAAQP